MDNYIDFKKYSGKDIKTMLREKQKEYIILIQSEKIAKLILNEYNRSLQITEYHYRVNKEYYTLCECAIKKQAIDNEEINNVIIPIPLKSIISRLEESRDLSSDEDKDLFNQIINEIKEKNANIEIIYENGILYYIDDNKEKIEITDDLLNSKGKAYTKIK